MLFGLRVQHTSAGYTATRAGLPCARRSLHGWPMVWCRCSALASGEWQLNQALISPTEEELAADGAVSAAKAIVVVAEHQSDRLRDNDQSCLFK